MPKLRPLWALGLVAALVLQACGAGAASTAPASETPSTAPSSASVEPSVQPTTPDLTGVKLTLWTALTTTDAQKKSFTRFNDETGAALEPVYIPDPFEDTVLTKWAAGDRPDILSLAPGPGYVSRLNPEKNLVDLSGEAFVGKTLAGMMDVLGKWKGKNYAVVTNSPSVEGLWYNKKVFDRLGLEPPHTFAEFMTVCEQVKAKDPSISTIFSGGGDVWPLHTFEGLLWSDDIKAGLADKINAGQAKFTDAEVVGHIQQLKDAIDKGCFNKNLSTATFADEQQALLDGKTAMVAQGPWFIDALVGTVGVATVNDTVGFSAFSDKTPTVAWLAVQIGTYFVTKNTDPEKEAAALEFIRWVSGDGYGQYLIDAKDMPVYPGFTAPADVPQPILDANEALQTSGALHNSTALQASYGSFVTFLSEMIAGTKTPQQVAESLQAEFSKSAKAMGMPGY
jgi:raffinose/stachyose/melibiose transport system substrate-binding protein